MLASVRPLPAPFDAIAAGRTAQIALAGPALLGSRLLTKDLARLLTVERLADHLSLAADLVLQVTVEACWKLVRARHTEMPRFAVVGYGKLGGKELGYASDLDIVFLYDDPHESAAEHYARLAQRMSAWLSSRTSAGVLFETDLALRPSGG